MRVRLLPLAVCCLLLVSVSCSREPKGSPEVERSLAALDEALAQKAAFDQRKEARIEALRGQLHQAGTDEQRYARSRELFQEYSSYQFDSAYSYVQRMRTLADRMGRPDECALAECARAFCLISAGLYKEAFDALEAASVEGLGAAAQLEYYRMQVRLNYSSNGYAYTEPYGSHYREQGALYSGKILEMLPEDSPVRQEYLANLMLENREFDESIVLFSALLENPALDLHDRAIYTSSVGWMLQCQGREDEAITAIAESAVCDLRSSTKETTALRMLADILSRRGEIERPTRYVRHSFDDANFYGARLRKIEVGAVLPIVERNLSERLGRERNLLALVLFFALLLALSAITALWFIRRQNRRLAHARLIIEERNAQLEEINVELAESNEIKTEYIGSSFYQNAEFIDKLASLQKMVDWMLTTRQYDELRRSMRESTINKERDAMYASFDDTFLQIFPSFVNDYNALFPETEQVTPQEGLTPEMRIFALIRLGVDEPGRIAKFLNYSIHTINTYKTRVKNRSWVENERFEAEIMRIGR